MSKLDNKRIFNKARTKIAAIMSDIMPEEEWLAKTLQEQQDYLGNIPVGDVQLIGPGGKEKLFAHGEESDVFKALANPASNPGIKGIVQKDIPNVVVKKPRGTLLNQINNAFRFDDQLLYKMDLLANSENRDIFPWHDFNMAGKGNIVSEWINDLDNPLLGAAKKSDIIDNLKKTIANGYNSPEPTLLEAIQKEIGKRFFANTIDTPVRRGASGIEYSIQDVIANRMGLAHNIGYDAMGNGKALDFLALPRNPGLLTKLKMLIQGAFK